MSHDTTCTHCGTLLPPDAVTKGNDVLCPICGVWTQQSPPLESSVSALRQSDDSDDLGDGLMECPWCAEEIPRDSRSCPECGRSTQGGRNREGHGTIELGEVFSETWELFKEHMGLLIGATLLVGIINGVAQLPENVIQRIAEQQHEPALALLSLVFILGRLILQIWLSLGLIQMQLNVVQGKKPDITDLFSGGPRLGTALLNSFVYGIGLIFSLLLLIIPGIIFALAFWPFLYIVVDRKRLSGLEPMSEAMRITQGNKLMLFVLGLAAMGINLCGLLAFCVGVLFTGPATSLMFVVAYEQMSGGQLNASRQSRRGGSRRRRDEYDDEESDEDEYAR